MSDKRTYIPVKVGKSGSKIHLGYFHHSEQRGAYHTKRYYGYICSVVNSHDINRWPSVHPLPDGTEINCAKCLALMETQPQESER